MSSHEQERYDISFASIDGRFACRGGILSPGVFWNRRLDRFNPMAFGCRGFSLVRGLYESFKLELRQMIVWRRYTHVAEIMR